MQILYSCLVGIVTFGILDYIWLAVIMKNFYLSQLESIVNIKDGSLVPYLPAVPLVYILGIFSIYYFVVRSSTNLNEAIFNGALFGFAMYAFYDLTNMSTLKGYTWTVVAVDTLWGTLLCATVSAVMFAVMHK